MKAMVLKEPHTLFELMDVPDPVAGPAEAVARVLACGAGLTIQHIKDAGGGVAATEAQARKVALSECSDKSCKILVADCN